MSKRTGRRYDILLTPETVAEECERQGTPASKTAVRTAIYAGEFAYVRVGRHRHTTAEDVAAWIESRRVEPRHQSAQAV